MLGCRSSRMRRSSLLTLIAAGMLVAGATPAWSVEPYFLRPVTAKATPDLPPKLFAALNADGSSLFTYSNGLEIPVCEIFWAKSIARPSTKAKDEALYGMLQPGALVGVIHVLNEIEYLRDFHYELLPGYYTMRYAVMANDGEPLHAHPPDFVLLSPAKTDRDPSLVPTHQELVHRGQLAGGGGTIPAFMSLVQFSRSGNQLPEVVTDDMGTCTLQVRLRLKSAKETKAEDLPFAMVVATPIPDTGGS